MLQNLPYWGKDVALLQNLPDCGKDITMLQNLLYCVKDIIDVTKFTRQWLRYYKCYKIYHTVVKI
jgi:hypothetical protein